MKVGIDLTNIRRTRWYECLLRFVFGGAVTAAAGMIATKFGPKVGGLFLAFPAIFTATATLVENHEREKKEHDGNAGPADGLNAAGVDALGAALGCVGLAAFGVVVWRFAGTLAPLPLLAAAFITWLIVAVVCWSIRKRF